RGSRGRGAAAGCLLSPAAGSGSKESSSMFALKRREFITVLGGAAATWSLAARGQQREKMRRIGVLMLYPDNDPQGQLRAASFRQGLEKLGWSVGRNVQIDFQWGLGDADW